VIRRSALYRRFSFCKTGSKLSRPRMPLHNSGPVEGEKPREPQTGCASVIMQVSITGEPTDQ
ncbi:hypothetical protein V4C53_34890, partial [Paraburkholderia azotifigens]|uniref:hypothetical protein n=1 Tax=Paraburkholderia azotifigens TaxID=2057004 RepID=UPI0031770E7B